MASGGGGDRKRGKIDQMQPGVVGTLTVRKMDSTAIQIQVRAGDTVADLKKQAAKQLGVSWYELNWTAATGKQSSKKATDLLDNDSVLDLRAMDEVSCIVALAANFPLESGIFNHLVVTGVTGEPIFGKPDDNGRLCVSGEVESWEGEEYPMPDGGTAVVIAEQRKLLVIGDADVEQDDPYISAGWSETVRLQPDNAPLLFGWRVRYVADGFSWSEYQGEIQTGGPAFGLTTKENLKENMSTGGAVGVITFAPTESRSAVFCQSGNGESHDTVGVQCKSSVVGEANADVLKLPANDAGGFDYDVLIAFDSAKHEVRASVGWGTAGSRMDKVTVPPGLWPSPELLLVPFVSLVCEDFAGFNNVSEGAQLPVSFEALTREQMADDAIQALCIKKEAESAAEIATTDESSQLLQRLLQCHRDSNAAAAAAEVETINGFWKSEKGECHIFNDKCTRKLSYEELIADGSLRLHGWLEPVAKEGDTRCWQAELMIIEKGEGPWYGPSCGDKPDIVGCIQVRLLAGGKEMSTLIKPAGEANWESPTIFKPVMEDDA